MAGVDQVMIMVPHIVQKFRWDCGLACSQMVLRHLNKNADDFEAACKSLDITESVWTIDLAHIMSHYGVRHLLCTITLGVDTTYSGKRFYKARFEADERRVNSLFQRAHELNVSVEKRPVSLDEIKDHLLHQNVAIVLVDCNLLHCLHCRNVRSAIGCAGGCLGKCIAKINSYQGHFIVICGYNAADRVIYYKNPASRKDHCVCTQETFDRARKAHGTDEDILFVYSEPSLDTNLTYERGDASQDLQS